MAKTNKIFTCVSCGSDVPPESKGVCECGFVVKSKKNSVIDGPLYVSMQYGDALGLLKHEHKGSQLRTKEEDLETSLDSWALNCSDEDRIAAMEDAVLMLKHVIKARASIGAIRTMTQFGKQIGDLSKTIEDYARNGGAFNAPAISKPAEEGGDSKGLQPFK